MRRLALLTLLGVVGIGLTSAACRERGVRVGVAVGVAPDCPYGYYEVPPYDCAPFGYYGPEWFVGGNFIGIGPWFHGPRRFRGHVDHDFRPDHGYRGQLPARGERPEEGRRIDGAHFRGNEIRDGRGRIMKK
jgi:hypothetical protein